MNAWMYRPVAESFFLSKSWNNHLQKYSNDSSVVNILQRNTKALLVKCARVSNYALTNKLSFTVVGGTDGASLQ